MSDILGKWQQPAGQPYPGLWFEFRPDGAFRAELEEMGISSSGTYRVEGNQIDMEQTQHTLGLLGHFEGIFVVEGEFLRMALNQPGQPRPTDLTTARLYKKIA